MEKRYTTLKKWGKTWKIVAEYLSVSKDTVRAWIRGNKIPFYKAGKRYKFKISEVDDYVRNGKISE